MKKLLLITIFTLFLVNLTPLFAQEHPITNSFADVELTVGTQSPWNSSVPVTVKFKPKVDSVKTEISWDFPSGLELVKKHPQFVSVVKGEVYSYEAVLKPDSVGTYSVAVSVTAWELESNYSSSESIIITFDENLIVSPPTLGYSGAVLMKNVVYVLGAITALVGLFFVGKLLWKRFKQWFFPQD